MTTLMMFLDDDEVISDFETWLFRLTTYQAYFYGELRSFEVVEWNITPASGGMIICQGYSPEGYQFKFSVMHDELAEEYRQQTGKDPDFVF